ncbi:MAG: hypothetical protein K0Q68_743 [Moraxellaceae bacterium]|jgi:hypothetical protein|nr:hypothetical protein [Moraxellaceae bacterium]
MPEPVLKSPVPEDILAVTGHCCSVRLTRLPDLEDGIDFTPDAASRAAFAALQQKAGATALVTPPAQASLLKTR